DRMFAELLGRAAGYCRGKGGSMHIADQETGNLGANAIVGGSVGIATGAAMSATMRGSDQVAVCFFGEGALGQGLLYETMNMAALWKYPVIYVCENNLYNEYTHHHETTAGSMKARAEAFGLMTSEVNGQNVREVHESAARLIERARRGDGPAFMLCHTYRYTGHHVGDINRAYYRTKDEELDWKTNRDPLKLLADWMTENKMADAGIFQQIESSVQAEVAAAVEYALNAPFPAPDEVSLHVYA
ncbi:MAG TPA: thiamine pyrophosphate-dependent dehydrogenase E1 component subunit alpha, partial [Anaerolineales bacterium]|nr:thiamine pyrophosphate-dependent dehydrogenase E1 component subunit alpha [Anaerolineales bacterium]